MPKVLLIEDEDAVRSLLRMVFEQAGYLVSEASDGSAGLHKASTEAPDVIVLDLMLPRLDGETVLRRLRQDPATAATPVLIVTASDSGADELKWEVGVANTFTKPFDPDLVVSRADKALGRSSE
jgi:DNA-binding response OmpR family regulator